jgi:hypothetical protein
MLSDFDIGSYEKHLASHTLTISSDLFRVERYFHNLFEHIILSVDKILVMIKFIK